jgi:hypothetical protein
MLQHKCHTPELYPPGLPPPGLRLSGLHPRGLLTRGLHPRGLKDLRTTGALGSAKLAPHAAYMKITSLELEKLRLGRVRRQAARRIGEIDARYEEIGIEKAALLAAMEALPQCTTGVRQGAQGSQSRRSRGVSLKY